MDHILPMDIKSHEMLMDLGPDVVVEAYLQALWEEVEEEDRRAAVELDGDAVLEKYLQGLWDKVEEEDDRVLSKAIDEGEDKTLRKGLKQVYTGKAVIEKKQNSKGAAAKPFFHCKACGPTDTATLKVKPDINLIGFDRCQSYCKVGDYYCIDCCENMALNLLELVYKDEFKAATPDQAIATAAIYLLRRCTVKQKPLVAVHYGFCCHCLNPEAYVDAPKEACSEECRERARSRRRRTQYTYKPPCVGGNMGGGGLDEREARAETNAPTLVDSSSAQ